MGHESNSKYFPKTAPSSYRNTLGVESWQGYEQKYPDYETEAVLWTPIWDAVNFVATTSDQDFSASVADYFDLPVINDYYLLCDLLLATDNHGKNLYFFVYDQTADDGKKVCFAPWDFDGSSGARWDGSTYYTSDYTQDYDNYLWSYEHGENTLYYQLRNSSSLGWSDQIAARYAELRTSVFNPDALAARYATYAELFSKSGADSREESLWSSSTKHSDIASAAQYCEDWIKGRIEALDSKYGYDPLVSGINATAAWSYLSVQGGERSLVVKCGQPRKIDIVSASGKVVRTLNASEGQTVVNGLEPGVYVAGGVKVVVR